MPWIASWGVGYRIGLDGINVLLVALTAFLGPLVVMGSWTAVQKDIKLFYAMVLFIQFAMLGTFLAQDLFLFYVFWEAMLIPMFLIIGLWGGERRIYATLKFVLYTAFGSILMLAALIYFVLSLARRRAAHVVRLRATCTARRCRWARRCGCSRRSPCRSRSRCRCSRCTRGCPMPTSRRRPTGSVILAGVLLKMGTYGFMKLGFPLFPEAARAMMPAIMMLAVISIVYGACLALVQTDIKKIIAYSSISHLGYVMLGLASLDLIGIQGAILQMVSHGLVAGGLFLMVGMIYERTHSRERRRLRRPRQDAAGLLGVLHAADARLDRPADHQRLRRRVHGAARRVQRRAGRRTSPATPCRSTLAVIAVSGVVLGALYMLWLAQRILFGEARAPHAPLTDLNAARDDDPRRARRGNLRDRPVPGRAARQDGARGTRIPAAAARRAGAAGEHDAMNWQRGDQGDAAGERAARRACWCCSASRSPGAARATGSRSRSSRWWSLPRRHSPLHTEAYVAAPFPGHFSVGPARSLAKFVIIALTVPVRPDLARRFRRHAATTCCCSSSLYGACLLVSSDSLPTMFLGLEIMSLPVYALVLLAQLRPDSAEAALKYLVLGGAATATFLMGVALLYGWTRLDGDRRVRDSLCSPPIRSRSAGVVLIVAALFLKAAIVPFHGWAPDAYEGASVPVTAFMATIIKAGVLFAALRLFGESRCSRRSSTCSPCCRWCRWSGATSPRSGRRASAA